MGGRYANIPGLNHGGYVESFMEFTGRRVELVTGVMERGCELLRIEWAKAHGA